MKAMPTLEGGLRIDAEEASDWEQLRAIITDANGCETDLASRLGGMISDEAGGEDWQEYVVPDLREDFQDCLAQVGAAIESAVHHASGEAGPIWITPEDVFPWYSALNQALLALEEQFHFGPDEDMELMSLPLESRSAYIRSCFYFSLQTLLLVHVMK